MAVNLGQVSSSGHLELVNLGNTYTQEMKNDISTGAFKICKTGCYLTINGTKYIFAHPDYWFNKGGSSNICTTHHMAVITAKRIGTGKMASSSNTPYSSSYMRQTTIVNTVVPKLQTDFGTDNILGINAGLVSGLDTNGYPNNWGYYTSKATLPTQMMLFGMLYCSYPTSNNYNFYNIGIDNDQFELFAKRPDLIPDEDGAYWLRDIYNGTNYNIVNPTGAVAWDSYSTTSNGIRPVFAIC